MEIDAILGDELLEEVLRRLHPHSFFPSSTDDVSLVSKRWLRLYRSSKSRLDLSLSPENCTAPSLSSFLSHFPHLSFLHIVISTVGGCGGDAISAFPDQILHSISLSCTKLTTLYLDHATVSLSPLLSLSNSCPHLTRLSISLSTSVSLHWLRFFRSLQTLSVCFKFVPGESKHLDDDASGGKYFDAELKLENLTMLYIRRGGYGFDWLWRSCKNLKKLQLVRCQGIGDDTSVSSFVNCFKGLQEVELQRCGFVVLEILSKVLVNCTSLNSLLIFNMASSYGLLHQFITHSRCSLQQLDLCLPHDLINYHLSAVADRFRGLLSLRLTLCHLVTGEGLRTMVLAMTNELQELALIDCKVEPGLLTILGQRFRNLRKLDLSYNGKLVDDEFIALLASCNCLRELRVRECEGLTNASVISMFKSCKQL
ncbi:hypothetical protein Vadar_024085 [Vaccinium darrowii]|uniref:Uncharacterized protein n=1 Tax=Vaccinium darrowii TaxID=229202 RepID=A0ACB7YGU6_9ERIC|nr:hypothetical protein Vadar_024085 [Vaccinium darrowii]